MMKNYLAFGLLCGVLAMVTLSCETAQVQSSPPADKGVLAGISIRPLNATVEVGDDLELVAKGFDSSRNEIPITPVWKQVSGIKYGILHTPGVAGNKAIITGVIKGKARVGIEIQGFTLEVDVIVKNVSMARAHKSFK